MSAELFERVPLQTIWNDPGGPFGHDVPPRSGSQESGSDKDRCRQPASDKLVDAGGEGAGVCVVESYDRAGAAGR